jgi:hypothetical protein
MAPRLTEENGVKAASGHLPVVLKRLTTQSLSAAIRQEHMDFHKKLYKAVAVHKSRAAEIGRWLWVLHCLSQHEAEHRSQIVWLRQRAERAR